MDKELVDYLDRRFEGVLRHVDGRFEAQREETDRRFGALQSELLEAREDLGARIRHTHVAIEDLHSLLQLVAEGVDLRREDIERLRLELRHGDREERELLKTAYRDLDQRVGVLEDPKS